MFIAAVSRCRVTAASIPSLSLQLDACSLDHLVPALDLLAHELAGRLRIAADNLRGQAAHLLDDLRLLERLGDISADPLGDLLRRAARRHHAEPGRRGE